MDAIERDDVRELATGYRSNAFLSLHSFNSGISFSPESDRLTFVAKSGGDEVLYVLSVPDGDVKQRVRLPHDIVRGPAWSPTDDRIAFSATTGGQTDLFVVDLTTEELTQLTNDLADEHDPAWYADGQRLVFARDANPTVAVEFVEDETGTVRLSPTDFESDQNVHRGGSGHDLHVLDVRTGSAELLVATGGRDAAPGRPGRRTPALRQRSERRSEPAHLRRRER